MRKILLITLLCALVVFGCEDKEDTHTHTWGEWQYNATEHWKECTANDGAEYGRGNHTGNPCTVCGYETPKPHESTITAFDRTAQVIGDASISTADFNTAVENLAAPLATLSSDSEMPTDRLNRYINMMTRGITIVLGNAVPAEVGGALIVGVDYLKSSDYMTIGSALVNLVNNGAFAE
jgi:hypothetical protein